jgi:YD repeat-containing protein
MNSQIIFRAGNLLPSDAASIKNMKSPTDIGGDLRWFTYGGQSCVRQWLGNGCLADVQPINGGDLTQGTRIRLYGYTATPSIVNVSGVNLYSTASLNEFRRIDIHRSTTADQLIIESRDNGSTTIMRKWIYTRSGTAPNYDWSLAEEYNYGGTLKKIREQTVVQNAGATVRTYYELAGFSGSTPILATTSVTRTTYTTFTLSDGSLRRRPTQRIRYENKGGTTPVSRIDWTYYDTDAAHAASYGRAKTRRDYIYNSDATNYLSFWEDYTYDRPVGSSVQTTTIYRSWHGSPVANYTQALKIHRIEMPLPTVSGMNRLDFPERYVVQTLSLNGQTLSYVGNVVTADTDSILVTQTVAADTNNYIIKRKYYGVSAPFFKRFRLQEILMPDKTLTTYDYATAGLDTLSRKHTVNSGWRDEETVPPTDHFHTQTETTYNRQGFEIMKVVKDLATNLITAHAEVIDLTNDIDSLGRPQKINYNQSANEYKTIMYGCCGVDEVREVDGRVTKYEMDELKRLKSVKEYFGKSSQLETTYSYGRRMDSSTELGGFSISRNREKGIDTALIDTVEHDAAGRLRKTIYPDANADPGPASETETVTYTALGDGKLTTTVTLPITTNVIVSSSTTAFGDGSVYEVSGPSVADTRYEYSTWSLGVGSRSGLTVTRIALSSGGATTERVTTFTDLAGRTVASRQSLGASADADTYYEYSATTNQLLRHIDPDGVTTLFAYNSRGERYRTAVDLNHSFAIETSVDRITESVTTVVTDAEPVGIAFKTESRVYFPGSNTPTVVSTSWTAADGLAGRTDDQGTQNSWFEERYGGTADPANGIWSRTTVHADGSKTISTYNLWRPKRNEAQNSAGSVVSWTEVTRYDPFGRADMFKQSRNNQETELTFYENGEIRTEKNIQANETTTYIRDPLGRVIQVQLPGGTGTQYKQYTLAGQVFKEYGTMQYPVRYSYDEQGRMKTMDTFRGLTIGAVPPNAGGSPDTTTWNYDAYSGRLIDKTYADGKKTQYTYTTAGRVHTRTWSRIVASESVVTTYKYALAGC